MRRILKEKRCKVCNDNGFVKWKTDEGIYIDKECPAHCKDKNMDKMTRHNHADNHERRAK
jgi:hypothetical protein